MILSTKQIPKRLFMSNTTTTFWSLIPPASVISMSCFNYTVLKFWPSYEPKTHVWNFQTAAIDGPGSTGSSAHQCWITTHCRPETEVNLVIDISKLINCCPFPSPLPNWITTFDMEKKGFWMGVRYGFLFTPTCCNQPNNVGATLDRLESFQNHPGQQNLKWLILNISGHVKLAWKWHLSFDATSWLSSGFVPSHLMPLARVAVYLVTPELQGLCKILI